MVPFALPRAALVLRPTLSAAKLTVGLPTLVIYNLRNWLFLYLTYILYHSFLFLSNYYNYEILYVAKQFFRFYALYQLSYSRKSERETGFEPATSVLEGLNI